MHFNQSGSGIWDFNLSKYGDRIKLSKMNIEIGNLLLGKMYFDLNSEIKGVNERTGDKLIINFKPKSWSKPSYITGECKDKNGKTVLTISGSWLDKIMITDSNGI